MKGRTGVTADTPKRLVFDAGEAFVNIDEEALVTSGLTAALTGAVKLGATRDGATFTPGRTIREVTADGLMGPTKGFRRRSRVEPRLEVNLLEMSFANLQKMIAGANATAPGAGGYGKIEGGPIEESDYLSNVALVATLGDTGEAVVLVVRNALVTESPELATSDDDEMTAGVVFAGHFDPANPTVEPWAIYHPGDSA